MTPTNPPSYALGEIPQISVPVGQVFTFDVDAPLGAVVTVDAPPGFRTRFAVNGTRISYSPRDGSQRCHLSCDNHLPPDCHSVCESILDALPFEITIRSEFNGMVSSQTVRVTPIPPVPQDASFLDDRPVPGATPPAADSLDYLTVTEEVATKGKKEFNEAVKTDTRRVTIAGKTVDFSDGAENDLFTRFSGKKDLEELVIRAETVIIGTRLEFPQTKVTIYARSLYFFGSGAIDTTPETSTADVQNAQSSYGSQGLEAGPGAPGRNGGDITLFVKATNLSGAGFASWRFNLSGGRGQKGGNGDAGIKGDPIPDLATAYPDCAVPFPWNSALGSDPQIIYIEKWECDSDYELSFGPYDCGTKNKDRWPGDGRPGLGAGAPGRGGDGGKLRSTLSTFLGYVRSDGGQAGAVGTYKDGSTTFPGGPAGTPKKSWKLVLKTSVEDFGCSEAACDNCSSNGTCRQRDCGFTTTCGCNIPTTPVLHLASDGPSGFSKTSSPGSPGAAILLAGAPEHAWLSAAALRKIVAHARDLYRERWSDQSGSVLRSYREILTAMEAAGEIDDRSADEQQEFAQLRTEIDALVARLDAGLDYFGKPAGWVPMLTFEIEKALYDDEIPHALRLLFLSEWVSGVAKTLKGNVRVLATQRTEVNADIAKLGETLADASAKLIALQDEAKEITSALNAFADALKAYEAALVNEAKENVEAAKRLPEWKLVLRVIGAVATVVPVGEPFTGAAGASLTFASNFNPDGDIADQVKGLTTLTGQLQKAQLQEKAVALRENAKAFFEQDLPNLDSPAKFKQAFDDARGVFGPILETSNSVANILEGVQVSDKEVQAELERIKASDPRFTEWTERVRRLNERNAKLAKGVEAALSTIHTVSSAIELDLLALADLEEKISQQAGVVDSRTVDYVADLANRARERLLFYRYSLIKAYAYRTLKQYDGAVGIDAVLARIQLMAKALPGDVEGPPEFPEGDERIKELTDLYGEISHDMIKKAASEFDVRNTTPVLTSNSWELSAEQLALLNQAGLRREDTALRVNLFEEGLFLETEEENIRLVDIQVAPGGEAGSCKNGMEATLTGAGPSPQFASVEVVIEHSGEGRLTSLTGGSGAAAEKTYLVRQATDPGANKVNWTVKYDLRTPDAPPSSVRLSPSVETLLNEYLDPPSSTGDFDALRFYFARPPAWADLNLRRVADVAGGGDITVDCLRLKVWYEFDRRPTKDVKPIVQVLSNPAYLEPYIVVSKKDLVGNSDGQGAFRRSYDSGTEVTFTAPAWVGGLTFRQWLRNGTAAVNTASYPLRVDGDVTLLAEYVPAALAPTCPGDCSHDSTVTIAELVAAVNAALGGELTCAASDVNADGKVTIDELVKAINSALTGCAS